VPPPENFVVRIARFGREISSMLLNSMSGDDASQPQQGVEKTTEPLAIEQPATRTPTIAGKTADASVVVPTRQNAAAPASSASTDSTLGYKDDLVLRIEHLEALLLKQERERQRQMKYQLERLKQSGTQNRMEDDLIQKWKHKPGTSTSGQDVQQSEVAAREQLQQQQPFAIDATGTGAGDDDVENETFGWSSLSKVKKVAEATLRQAADQIMPLLGESSRDGELDTQELTKDPAVNEASSTFLKVHPNESSIRGQTDNDTSVSGNDHVVPQDAGVRPGSFDTDEGGTDRKRNKWWKLW
jgi:hypothetical protein